MLEPYELLCVANLVETVGVGCQVVLIEEIAIRAEAIHNVMLVLNDLCIFVGEGGTFVDVAITVESAVHVNLCMSGVEYRLFVCSQSLIPTYR